MPLADGEYDLDVKCLLEQNVDGNFALRYGFIPDSMDQTKPVILYQNEQETLVKTSTTDSSGDPILFEGITQQIRPSTTGSNEQFYLSYHGDSGENTVVLKKLDSTIRLNKSRNIKGLMSKIASWEKEKLTSNNVVPSTSTQTLHFPKMTDKLDPSNEFQSDSTNTSRTTKSNVMRKSNITTNSEVSLKSSFHQSGDLNKSDVNSTSKTTPQISSKRPPVSRGSTPDISTGDFEGLDDEEISFPTFNIGEPEPEPEPPKKQIPPKKSEPTKTQNTSKKTAKKMPEPSKKITAPLKKPTAKRAGKTVPKSSATVESSDVNMDDAFKDLEDQLQEVLEEEDGYVPSQTSGNDNNNSTNNNDINIHTGQKTVGGTNSITSNLINDSFDEESDEDDYQYSGNPFVININEGEESKHVTKDNYTTNIGLKPMSLRDLVGNRNDDMSSSEEE